VRGRLSRRIGAQRAAFAGGATPAQLLKRAWYRRAQKTIGQRACENPNVPFPQGNVILEEDCNVECGPSRLVVNPLCSRNDAILEALALLMRPLSRLGWEMERSDLDSQASSRAVHDKVGGLGLSSFARWDVRNGSSARGQVETLARFVGHFGPGFGVPDNLPSRRVLSRIPAT
jgi:hypothetical protein